jgi:hypothetical protein
MTLDSGFRRNGLKRMAGMDWKDAGFRLVLEWGDREAEEAGIRHEPLRVHQQR